MPPVFRYSDPLGTEQAAVTVDLGQAVVRYGNFALQQSANFGQADISSLEIDDPGAAYDFQGLRAFHVHESSASSNQMFYRGVIEDQHITRGDSMRTTSARKWTLDLADFNWHLGKRVLTDADAKRPDETAGDRIRWLLNSAAHFALNDYGHVTYPTHQMEANDYRGQHPGDLLSDCAIETGYNFWCEWNETQSGPELFFIHPDSTSYGGIFQISNDLADLDLAAIAAGTNNVFEPYEDAELIRSPERIAYGVYLAYANGAVYVRKDVTGAQFAKQDQTSSMTNVKHQARALRVAQHFLDDNDEQDEHITCAIIVPAARVNELKAGQRISAKFTHFPGWTDFRDCRVLHRTMSQTTDLGQAYYKFDLELVPVGPSSAPGEEPADSIPTGAQAICYRPSSAADSSATKNIYFTSDGDIPQGEGGKPITTPPFTYLNHRDGGDGLVNDSDGIVCSANGTVASIYYGAGTSSVWGAGTVITLHLLKNGAQIASLSTASMSGFTNVNLSSHISNYTINAGDQFTMTMTRDSGSGSFGVGGGNKPYGLWIIK